MSTLLFSPKSLPFSTFIVRVTLFLVVISTAFTGPWWFSFGLAAVLIFFSHSYELLIGGLILDIIFAQEAFSLPVGDFVFTSLLLSLISISWMLSRHVQGIQTK